MAENLFNRRLRMTNGVITVYDGTFAMMGTGRIGDIQNALDAGTIKLASGYSYTLSNETGDSVLTGFKPDYPSWAATWGVDIGSGTNDYYAVTNSIDTAAAKKFIRLKIVNL